MAKWGEGDPRWIVEERADATNVNNWHWTEKNATQWSKDKLKKLLEGLKIEDDAYCCEITELTKVDGEASANNRKAKLIFFFEWVLEAKWKGKMIGSDTNYNGSLEIPNLSDENDAEEIDVSISMKSSKDEAFKVKEFMRIKGTQNIRDKLGKYITDLKHEFSQGMILEAKDKKQTQQSSATQTTISKSQTSPTVTVSSAPKSNQKVKCGCIKDTQEFHCRPGDLYMALTEPQMVKAFTRGPCEVVAEKGGSFSLFDGNVHGKFLELESSKKLVMKWRYKSWPADHYSTVTLDFTDKSDGMEISLTQTSVPDYDLERTKEGWRNHYWQSIKQTFGFGIRLC